MSGAKNTALTFPAEDTQSDKSRNVMTAPICVPRRNVVTLTIVPGSKTTCVEIMSKAKSKINLSDTGIPEIHVCRSLAGSIIMKSPDENQ